MTSEPEQGPNEFQDMFLLALDHGYAMIQENGGPLTPFVMIQRTDGEKGIHRFATEMLEDGLDEARAYVARERTSIGMYAIAWDGYATVDGERTDAVLVEAGQRGEEQGVLVCQRYRPLDDLSRPFGVFAQPIGEPVFLDYVASRLT